MRRRAQSPVQSAQADFVPLLPWFQPPGGGFSVIRRLFFLSLIAAVVVVAVRRPDWRLAAQRAASPYLRRAAAPLIERVRAWRGQHPAARPPSAPEASRQPPVVSEETRRPMPDEGGTPSNEPSVGDTRGRSTEHAAEPEEMSIPPAGNLVPRLPALHLSPPLPASLRELQGTVAAHPSAAGYRRLADAAAAGFPEVAAGAHRRQAPIYRRRGDPNAAAVEELKAGRYHSEGHLYLHAPEPPPSKLYTGGRLEPPYGALLGAFIDRDDQLENSFMDESWQTHRDPQDFEERAGKKHASFFCYVRYGQPFPSRWAVRLRDEGVIPHIAWEPRRLAEVADDRYLNRFADALARFDAPVFIRFAGEMNGDWTPYHGDPARYRQKFRLVHRVIAQRAPKAALIWCVNSVPDTGIEASYPGDDAVDWVGVNLYNVPYFDNDRDR